MSKDKNKKGIIGEFKEFISRGNVIDMAVGLIIGSAFTAIVNSLVSDIFMPLLGIVTGSVDFKELKIVLQAAVTEGEEIIKPEISLNYGSFIQYVINFVLVAVAVFLMVKAINTLRKKADALKKKEAEEAAAVEEKKPDLQLELLTEIRDLLKEKKA